jgi:phosphohistidine phosphatase
MELFLMRHGIAAERDAGLFPDDSHRPLTPQGLMRTRKVVKAMKALKLRFDLVLTSPFVRAKQTADIVVEVFEIQQRLRLSSRLIPGTKPRDLVGELERLCTPGDRVLLVGHEPDLGQLASLLIFGKPHAGITLKKAGLIKLAVEELKCGRCATLEFLLPPKLLLR